MDLLRDALVIGEGDGNEFTFLLPGGAPWAVCNLEHETGIELFPSFEALFDCTGHPAVRRCSRSPGREASCATPCASPMASSSSFSSCHP